MTAIDDTIQGEPITVATDATGWAQPTGAGWFARCRQVNQMLKTKSRRYTHLLYVPSVDDAEPTWYAGVAGTSLAAGIERMAVEHEKLRDTLVVFPLDARIYTADVQQGLVRDEGLLYPEGFQQNVQRWRTEGRNFTLLTGGGNQAVELPNPAELPVDIDADAMTFKHASLALLSFGMLRWRDCWTVVGISVLAASLSLGLAWWQRAPAIEPMQRVAALVANKPSPPPRHSASVELATLALLGADHDPTLWRVHGASELTYEPAQGAFTLYATTAAPVSAEAAVFATSPSVPPLEPYSIHAYATRLTGHLASPAWTLTFGDPYPIGTDAELEQHVTVAVDRSRSVNAENDNEVASVVPALVELSERLRRLPITLHLATCSVKDGVVATCTLQFAIRGASA